MIGPREWLSLVPKGNSQLWICLNSVPLPGKETGLSFRCTRQLLANGHSGGSEAPRTPSSLSVGQSCPAAKRVEGTAFRNKAQRSGRGVHRNGKRDVRAWAGLTSWVPHISGCSWEPYISDSHHFFQVFLTPLKSHSHSCFLLWRPLVRHRRLINNGEHRLFPWFLQSNSYQESCVAPPVWLNGWTWT